MSEDHVTRADAAHVPRALRVSAALAWRFLAIVGALYVLGWVVAKISIVVIPVAIALLLAALLAPAVSALTRWHVPRGLATAVVFVAGLAAVGGVLTFVINAFIAGFPDLRTQVLASLEQIRQWLATGPLHLGDKQINEWIDQAQAWLKQNVAVFASRALATASTFGNILTGIVLMLFTLIFFLYDGRRIWSFLLRAAPSNVRAKVDAAGTRGFASLVGFVRATALVAVGDALGIGIGLAVIGVPLAVPLSALVFLSAFVPIIGAILSGAVAVLVALVTKGWIAALLVVAVVLGVQQLEGNILQPLLIGRAVKLHVLAIVLAISVGFLVAGIAGALLAVPTMAVLNSAIRTLVSGEHHETADHGHTDSGGKPEEGDPDDVGSEDERLNPADRPPQRDESDEDDAPATDEDPDDDREAVDAD